MIIYFISPPPQASPSIVNSSPGAAIPAQDLYQLNQYIQEALAREQLLETKLAVLQRLVGQTEVASSDAWKSLIDEDRLLTRVEILESQLSAYSKAREFFDIFQIMMHLQFSLVTISVHD